MRNFISCISIIFILSNLSWGEGELNVAALAGKSEKIIFDGKGSVQQLVITLNEGSKQLDVTQNVKYIISPDNLATCDANGKVKPKENGKGHVKIVYKEKQEAFIHFEVKNIAKEKESDFSNEVMPLLTQAHCNSGGCHGKAGGRNGFRLSLLGYEPLKDFNYIVNENKGRRVSPAAPEQSLLLQKATGEIPHLGGVRWEVGSEAYEAVKKWIAQGMPYDPEKEKKVTGIELYPTGRTYLPNSKQQLVVTATYNDGTKQDITHLAQYETNEEDMVEVNHKGFVNFKSRWGSASVLVRFKEHVSTFFGNITLGENIKTPLSNNFIDDHIFNKLKLLGLPASKLCDDATFLRRVHLDIAGQLPTTQAVEDFLKSKDKNKRSKIIDTLLNSTNYAHHFANKWMVLLRNQRSRYDGARLTFAFYDWIFNAMNGNMSYDKFVKSIVTATGESNANPSVIWYRSLKTDIDFIVEEKQKSEDFAQIFLGVRISCAQCHHHPFDQWSQDDYRGLTAFFSGLKIKSGVTKDEMVLVKEKKLSKFNDIPPTLLGGHEVKASKVKDVRFDLAKWMSAKENPYFSKSLVNRYWKQFFGRGLVDPIDDMRKTNPPSHPDLLNELANFFYENKFDLKALIRLICNSKSYQLSSDPNEFNLKDQQNYSRFIPRHLTAEVFLDSINDVTEMKDSFPNQEKGKTRVIQLPDNAYNSKVQFLKTFGRPEMDSASDSSRKSDATISQSLAMINSSDIHKRLAYSGGRAARLSKDKGSIEEQVTELFLASFSRYPNKVEKDLAISHINKNIEKAKGNTSKEVQYKKEAIEDLLWALINTKEFMFNH